MNKSITDAELEIMRLLWRERKPLKFSKIQAELEQSKGWNRSTIYSLVYRLRDKDVIAPLDRYGPAQYVPLVTEDEYILEEEKAVLEKFGSAKKLVLAMVQNGHLTDADIDELRGHFKVRGDGQ